MADRNPVQPHYQEMVDQMPERRPHIENAVTETQEQIQQMSAGERWSQEATQRSYRGGGNQGEFTAAAVEPGDTAEAVDPEA